MRVGSEGQIVSKRERRKEKRGERGERKERRGEVEGWRVGGRSVSV